MLIVDINGLGRKQHYFLWVVVLNIIIFITAKTLEIIVDFLNFGIVCITQTNILFKW